MLFTGDISELRKREDVEYGFVFEDRPDLELLGFVKHAYNNYNVHCIRCSTCEKDPELFGLALFTSRLSDMRKGWYPCGCAGKVLWTEKQWTILAERRCTELGYTLLGWAEPFKGAITLCDLRCETHGIWDSSRLSNLVNLRIGCPSCGSKTKSDKGKINNPLIITEEAFFSSGKYHPDTKFTHLGQRDTSCIATYWRVDCPVCGISGESQSARLKLGSYCCGCSNFKNQTEAYINIVYDNKIPIALKFGVSFNSKSRVKLQNYHSVYEVENKFIFDFPSTLFTRNAERECKRQLICGIISKEYMIDGYTETTYISNIEDIIKIYKDNGGIQRT